MILGDAALAAAPGPAGQNRVTLDDIFRRVAQRRPGALALADPPNRMTFTDGAPRRLTFAEADRMITAIAGRLRQMGLATDADRRHPIAQHGRKYSRPPRRDAGRHDRGAPAAVVAARRYHRGAGAARRQGADHLRPCRRFQPLPVRHARRRRSVLDPLRLRFRRRTARRRGAVRRSVHRRENRSCSAARARRTEHPAAHVAAITFDVGEGGVVPVARNHLELLAGGLGVLLESRLAQDGIVLSTLAPASFAGLCMTLLPWLLCGGTLLLHHPFDPAVLVGQWRGTERCGALILPGPLAFRLAEAGVFSDTGPACVVATWRSPERLSQARFGTSATVPSSTSRCSAKPAWSPRAAVSADGQRRSRSVRLLRRAAAPARCASPS